MLITCFQPTFVISTTQPNPMVLTEVLQHTVSLQLSVSDLVLQQDEFFLILQLEHHQPPLAVLQLVYQLLFDLNLTGQVSQVRLEVSCRLWGAKVRRSHFTFFMNCPFVYYNKCQNSATLTHLYLFFTDIRPKLTHVSF